ncbi:ComF family protein [Pengzhenrongella sicca]|uniref:ComF family protein n=1 Tax=Pengzhenrongella sicca TaxID=2819238 RepID=A0A8A4ZH48_9MICO|nr:phosphoribosyltransferase family protein [Pengzhenrongella sicca]QTE30283.1 ComF family protein [Pengzhenrongella sicca]
MEGARWPGELRAAVRDLGRLVLPVECAGCGAFDEPLCERCRALLAGPPVRCERSAPRLDRLDGRLPLPVWALAPYTSPVRELVVAWKDRGRVDLTAALGEALAAGTADVARALRALPATGPGPARLPVLVVPAPSAGAARRRRGVDLVGELAVAVARACTAVGVPAQAAAVLAQRRGARDQVGLGARARGGNLGDRVRWRTRAPLPAPGQPVLLVDDVLTTGATLAACERAVERAGARVVGALTLAVTPPPGGFGSAGPTAAGRP